MYFGAMRRRTLTFLPLILLVACCASKPETGCSGGLGAEQCFAFCKNFSSCSECAAQPACGWCAAAPGSSAASAVSSQCMPALKGEDHRSEMPSRCEAAWFYRPSDPEVPSAPPFCPPIPIPGEGDSSATAGGESS
jgi:hypothetical protein